MAVTAVLKPKKAKTRTKTTSRLLPVLQNLSMGVVSTATLNGATLNAKLQNAIVGLERDLTIDGANQLSVQIFDPDGDMLRADLLGGRLDIDLGAGGRWRMDRSRDIGGLSLSGDTLTLRFWDLASAALRGQTKPLRVSSDRLDIGGFAGFLAREVKSDVIIKVVAPYPGDVPPDERTTTEVSGAPRGASSSAAGFSAKSRLKGKVDEGGNSNVLTSSQLKNAATVLAVARKEKAPPKATLALVLACLVEGPDFTNSSKVVDHTSVGILQLLASHGSVAFRMDIENVCRLFLRKGFTGAGGAIALARKNPTWSAGQIAQACQGSDYPSRYDLSGDHGRKIIDAWKGGSSSDGSTSSTSATVSRPAQWRRGGSKTVESSWSALDREAKRLGRRRFIALPWLSSPRLVVAADESLIAAQPHQTISGLDDGVLTESPTIELEGIKRLQTVDLAVVTSGWIAPPGAVVELEDCGPADGPWIVQRLTAAAGSDTATVTLQKPTTKVEARQDQTSKASASTASTSSAGGSTGGNAVYARAAEISQQNLPYVWGGGHSRAGRPDGGTGRDPGTGYDCSGYVYACLAAAGYGIKPGQPTGNSTTLMSWGKPGKGTEFTVWANNGHTFIEFHGKHAGKWADTSAGNYRSGNKRSGPHLRTGSRPTAGFTSRHWPGH